jgi:hypothetical protein
VVYKKDLSHFRTIQARHEQIALNESNKEKNNFKGIINKKSYPSDIQFELDSYKRPQQKIALLCGSPGAGVCLLILFGKYRCKCFLFIRKRLLHMLLLDMQDIMLLK